MQFSHILLFAVPAYAILPAVILSPFARREVMLIVVANYCVVAIIAKYQGFLFVCRDSGWFFSPHFIC